MRMQHYLLPTMRDIPSDADIVSHQLMLKAGLMRQLASGLYTYLPLGYRVLYKVEQIVRQEMDKAGAQEIRMPALHPAELWQESGRWDVYGPELMRMRDRHDREFALAPTHEEVITAHMSDEVKSYKQLPMNLYQIQTKFRDERRPRFGVLRSREFIMKDAYSFNADRESLDQSYQQMYDAYRSIFTRCGFNFRAVEADSGAIGGQGSHEFMVLSEVGEDTIAYCDSCDYAANLEKAEVAISDYEQLNVKERGNLESLHTPDIKSIDQLSQHLEMDHRRLIKAVALDADGEAVIALVRGDYELNEVKVKNVLDASVVQLLSGEQISERLHSSAGFIGPIGLPDNIRVLADYSVKHIQQAVCGANEADKHFIHAEPERDFQVERYADLRTVVVGDPCPHCEQGTLQFAEGIEVGHVFKLGTKYSEALGATFLDEQGKAQPFIMGCYGIGVTRIVAALIEQHHDDRGIIWPTTIAPYDVHLITVNVKDESQKQLGDTLYTQLNEAGLDVLFDDRPQRAGVKFNDADLIGLPLRVTIGKKASEGIVECQVRRTDQFHEVDIHELIDFARETLLNLQEVERS